MGKLKIVKVAKDSGWYNDRALIEGRVVEYSGITVTASGIHSIDCNFTLEDGQNVNYIRCSEVEEVMRKFKVGDDVEINKEKLSLKSLHGTRYYRIGEGRYNCTYPKNIGVISGGPDGDGDYLVRGVSSLYWIPPSCLKLKKMELVALKDMSIEAFCEATDNRDEWFCAGITYLIEHEVFTSDEQIWVEQLDDFRREHPLFWHWLIDEGFIGEKEELKPCPFCGESSFLTRNDEGEQTSIVCNFNRGGCGAQSGYTDPEEQPTYRWNMRKGA